MPTTSLSVLPVSKQPEPTVTIAAVIPPILTMYHWNVPFRSGLTQTQKDSITAMLDRQTKAGKGLSETDARNYAYAVGETNWQSFVGKNQVELSSVSTDIYPLVLTAAQLKKSETAVKIATPLQSTPQKPTLVSQLTASALKVADSVKAALPQAGKTLAALAASALIVVGTAFIIWGENTSLGIIKPPQEIPNTSETILGKTIGNLASYAWAGAEYISGGGMISTGAAASGLGALAALPSGGTSLVLSGAGVLSMAEGLAVISHATAMVGYTAGNDGGDFFTDEKLSTLI